MERPALKQSLTDINVWKIDVVVVYVYKVDRLREKGAFSIEGAVHSVSLSLLQLGTSQKPSAEKAKNSPAS
jgi:DNA invertase Pin-like site-specific DNA recombinase